MKLLEKKRAGKAVKMAPLSSNFPLPISFIAHIPARENTA